VPIKLPTDVVHAACVLALCFSMWRPKMLHVPQANWENRVRVAGNRVKL
jgi:hypothetical protein